MVPKCHSSFPRSGFAARKRGKGERERERVRWRRICETSLRKYAQLNFSTPVSLLPPPSPGPWLSPLSRHPCSLRPALFATPRRVHHPRTHRGRSTVKGSLHPWLVASREHETEEMMADFPSLGFLLSFFPSFLPLPSSLEDRLPSSNDSSILANR